MNLMLHLTIPSIRVDLGQRRHLRFFLLFPELEIIIEFSAAGEFRIVVL